MSAPSEAGLESLLDFMQRQRGFDFTGYKRPSLMRRILRRMQMVGVAAFAEYQRYLEDYPEEFAQLFNTILINVTSFFRDPESWDLLSREVLPALLAEKGPRSPLRVWSAG